ncbi:putative helicase senataxin [Caerostris extrusa]|uniref:Helicase senataxin n=1 Tax=Caerostris extrusa TaxID=172846 RepID=A0AAV4SMQ0_CAEEX|nr:putative helicase senataxin [Caerostris extrusa]
MVYFLEELNPETYEKIKIFLNSDEVVVGQCRIFSLRRFRKVSKYHASFFKKHGSWYVRDLKSHNKLYVNLEEVHSEWGPLEIGDIIGFGTPYLSEDGGFVCVFASKTRVKSKSFIENKSENPVSSTIQQDHLQDGESTNKPITEQELNSTVSGTGTMNSDDNIRFSEDCKVFVAAVLQLCCQIFKNEYLWKNRIDDIKITQN